MQLLKKYPKAALLLTLVTALTLASYLTRDNSVWNSFKNPETTKLLKQFVALKEARVNASTNGMPAEIGALFKYAERGDWLALSNSFCELDERLIKLRRHETSQPSYESVWTAIVDFVSEVKKKIDLHRREEAEKLLRLQGTPWESIKEVRGAFDGFIVGDENYSTRFGQDIISSVPPGSIYFGGTDPGRFIVTAMCRSQVDGDPFFVLTQNALADGSYLEYLRSMFGGKIYLPTAEDSARCFQDYMENAQKRMQNHQLKPGENVQNDEKSGRIQVSGQVAVMELNGLLVKTIFDKNPGREFYVEESFPLDWMYPHLEPHGLIMKINRQPMEKLSDEAVQNDHDYWMKYVQPMIGDWLKDDTSVAEVAAFARKTFLRQDFSGFKGDPLFVQSAGAQKMFSKLRSSIGGLYAWRAKNTADALEKKRMNDAADLAFRQAWALCPDSLEAVFGYMSVLMSQNRATDALLVAEAASEMPQLQGKEGEQLRALVKELPKPK